MNLDQLNNQKTSPVFDIGIPWLRPLFRYESLGYLPIGCQITITGDPGVGKTRFALQLLDAIAKANPELQTEFHSYEASGPMLKNLVNTLGIKNIDGYEFIKENPQFGNDIVTVVDSIDWWAQATWNSEYPTADMAKYLASIKDRGCTCLLIHHRTKTGNKISGSTKFLQLTDVLIEMKKENKHIKIHTPNKNRYPGNKNNILVHHTPNGLEPIPPSVTEKMWSSVVSYFNK